jgi:hypothetical protein
MVDQATARLTTCRYFKEGAIRWDLFVSFAALLPQCPDSMKTLPSGGLPQIASFVPYQKTVCLNGQCHPVGAG